MNIFVIQHELQQHLFFYQIGLEFILPTQEPQRMIYNLKLLLSVLQFVTIPTENMPLVRLRKNNRNGSNALLKSFPTLQVQ